MQQASVLTTGAMGEPPGFSLYLTTTEKLRNFDEVFEEKMRWLQEVLEDAKRKFGSNEVADFPKTPAMRRKRQRIRRVSTIHEDETENYLPLRGKRNSRLSINGRARKSKESTVPLRRSARNSARANTMMKGTRSSSRISKKVQLNVSNVEAIQEASPSDTSSSDDIDVPEKTVTVDLPKQRADCRVSTTAEEPMETRHSTQEAPAKSETVAQEVEPETSSQSLRKATKRSTTANPSQGSKKLRLNSGECVSIVSDDTSSGECDSNNKPSNDKPELKQNTSELTLSKPKLDAQQDEVGIQSTEQKRQNAASRYKDHVKRLINRHEHLIADAQQSSDEEFQSPKCKRATVQKAKQPSTEKNLKTNLNKGKKTAAKKVQEPVQDQVKDGVLMSSQEAQPEEDASESNENTSTSEASSNESSPDKMEPESPAPQTSEMQPPSEEAEKPSDIAADVNKLIAGEHSLEQHNIAEDSLNTVKTAETHEQKVVECSPDRINMTTDSLEQHSITDDSLDPNYSNDSLNQSSSKWRTVRQSLRRSARRSARRSSITVSKSKKRSSIYNHRNSVRKSLHQSMHNLHDTRHSTNHSTRASMRASTHANRRASNQANTSASSDVNRSTMDNALHVMNDGNQIAIEEEVTPATPVEKETSPPESMTKNAPVINQDTQRITRAASRLATKKEIPTPETVKLNQQTPQAEAESSSDEDIVGKTPSPECPRNKVLRPRGTFLNSAKKEPRILNNLHGMVSSFIKRNTPQKQTASERQQEIKRNIMNKQRREEENRRRIEAEKQKQRELQKRKREERMKKVTETRERHAALQDQKRKELEQKQQQMSKLVSKQKEDKKLEETQKKQILMKKKAETEERRKHEEQARIAKMQAQEEEQRRLREMILRKKEYEEQERQRRIDEARRQQELRQAEMERQRMEELQRRREIELAKEREQQQLKEKRELERRMEMERRLEMERKREQERRAKEEAMEKEKRLEAERMVRERQREQDEKHLADLMQRERERRELERRQQEQAEHERLKASILKHNTSACLNTSSTLNTTATLNTTVNKDASPTCYAMTPKRQPLPSTSDNYNIDDLDSGDSTDEEEAPRKKIPSWAGGAFLKAALIRQRYHPPPNLDLLFGALIPPDLSVIFAQKKPRYFKRTSSAIWTSPIM